MEAVVGLVELDVVHTVGLELLAQRARRFVLDVARVVKRPQRVGETKQVGLAPRAGSLSLLGLLAGRDVVVLRRVAIAAIRVEARQPDAAVRRAAALDAQRPLRVDDFREDRHPVAIVIRKHLAAEPPDHVLGPQAAQALQRRVDEEVAPVDRLAACIAHQLAHGEALIHRLEQPAMPGLALAQRRLGARLLRRRPGPFGDLANQLALLFGPGAGRGRVHAEGGHPAVVLDEDHRHERPHVYGVEGGERRFGDARIAPHVVDHHHPAAPAFLEQHAIGRQRQAIGERRHAVRVAAAQHRPVPVDFGVGGAVHAEVRAEQPGRFDLH